MCKRRLYDVHLVKLIQLQKEQLSADLAIDELLKAIKAKRLSSVYYCTPNFEGQTTFLELQPSPKDSSAPHFSRCERCPHEARSRRRERDFR